MKRITIEPISRIEGHGKSQFNWMMKATWPERISRDPDSRLEKFTKAAILRDAALRAHLRHLPISHLLASAKACRCDHGREDSSRGAQVARACTFAQIVQSHALSFFYLSAPDFYWNEFQCGEAERYGRYCRLSRTGARRHRIAQVRPAGSRGAGSGAGHTSWIVPGGVAKPLAAPVRDRILSELPRRRRLLSVRFLSSSARSTTLRNRSPSSDRFQPVCGDGERQGRPAALRRHAPFPERIGRNR